MIFDGIGLCSSIRLKAFEPIVHRDGSSGAKVECSPRRKITAIKSVFMPGTRATIGLNARDLSLTFEGGRMRHCACLFGSGLPGGFD